MKRIMIMLLLVLNTIVLLGQLWPEGAPPFARIVNIITLGLNIAFFMSLIKISKIKTPKD